MLGNPFQNGAAFVVVAFSAHQRIAHDIQRQGANEGFGDCHCIAIESGNGGVMEKSVFGSGSARGGLHGLFVLSVKGGGDKNCGLKEIAQ